MLDPKLLRSDLNAVATSLKPSATILIPMLLLLWKPSAKRCSWLLKASSTSAIATPKPWVS